MRCATLLLSSALAFAGVAAAAESAGKVLFTDTFQSAQLAPEWQVIEGKWGIEDGSLACRDGGTIALNVPPGGRFALEFEIAFPSNWMSIIPFFTGPEDYGTLYLGGGYWETFEMAGEELANYVQRKDPEIVRTGGFQNVRVVSEYGVISFTYDGNPKGPGVLPYRPGRGSPSAHCPSPACCGSGTSGLSNSRPKTGRPWRRCWLPTSPRAWSTRTAARRANWVTPDAGPWTPRPARRR